jgi:hypothetical protein
MAAGAELHIIGRDQVTTDLPEWRHDKGKALRGYNGLTRDERTPGDGRVADELRGEESAEAGAGAAGGKKIALHFYKLRDGGGFRHGDTFFAQTGQVKLDSFTNQSLGLCKRFAQGYAPWQVRHVSSKSCRAFLNYDGVFHCVSFPASLLEYTV